MSLGGLPDLDDLRPAVLEVALGVGAESVLVRPAGLLLSLLLALHRGLAGLPAVASAPRSRIQPAHFPDAAYASPGDPAVGRRAHNDGRSTVVSRCILLRRGHVHNARLRGGHPRAAVADPRADDGDVGIVRVRL